MQLSVLDLAPVVRGSTPADALAASLRLAQATERLGYHRFWVAEHHNMPGIASSSPPVLIAHLAAGTSTIRLGSGGVMLPNHSSLVVAEQFGMLEALHPGRIDLGLGRAPGTDGITAVALRRSRDISGDDFPRQVVELLAYFHDDWPAEHPFAKIHAVPARGYQPALWLLGSSDFSAVMAGQLGLPFSFAHHFAGDNTMAAVAAYREHFRPSPTLEQPVRDARRQRPVRADGRGGGLPRRVRSAGDPAPAPGSAGRVPDPGGGRRVRLHPDGEGGRSAAGRPTTSSATPRRSSPAWRRWSPGPAPTS